jgi:hypothetical protein
VIRGRDVSGRNGPGAAPKLAAGGDVIPGEVKPDDDDRSCGRTITADLEAEEHAAARAGVALDGHEHSCPTARSTPRGATVSSAPERYARITPRSSTSGAGPLSGAADVSYSAADAEHMSDGAGTLGSECRLG